MAYHHPPGTTTTTCHIHGCERPRTGRHKDCAMHLSRRSKGRDMFAPLPRERAIANRDARFWSSVRKGTPDECWPWTGKGSMSIGYGAFTFLSKRYGAHRMAYELTYGPIPEGKNVLHRCDNPPCCNPDHLWLGSLADNNHDMIAKGRAYWQKGENDVRSI